MLLERFWLLDRSVIRIMVAFNKKDIRCNWCITISNRKKTSNLFLHLGNIISLPKAFNFILEVKIRTYFDINRNYIIVVKPERNTLRWYFAKRSQAFLDGSPTLLVVRSSPEISIFIGFPFISEFWWYLKWRFFAIFAHYASST